MILRSAKLRPKSRLAQLDFERCAEDSSNDHLVQGMQWANCLIAFVACLYLVFAHVFTTKPYIMKLSVLYRHRNFTNWPFLCDLRDTSHETQITEKKNGVGLSEKAFRNNSVQSYKLTRRRKTKEGGVVHLWKGTLWLWNCESRKGQQNDDRPHTVQ